VVLATVGKFRNIALAIERAGEKLHGNPS
jgi:hypothetical protein